MQYTTHRPLIRFLTLAVVTLSALFPTCQNDPGVPDETFLESDSLATDTTPAGRHYAQAEEFAEAAQYDSALVYFEKAAHLYEADERWASYIQCYNRMGELSWRGGALDQAEDYLQEALEKGQHLGDNSHLEVGRTYRQLGNVSRQKGNYEQAFTYAQQALAIMQATVGEQHPEVARVYSNLGVNYWHMGDYEQSLLFFNKALVIQQEILDERHPDLAGTFSNMGLIYWSKGDYEQAINFHTKALSIQLKTPDEQASNIAATYNNMGLIYWSKGDYEQAINFHTKALAIAQTTLGEQHPHVARIYNGIASAYRDKEDFDKALEYIEKALTILRNTLGDQHPDVAKVYSNKGVIHWSRGDYDEASEIYQRSLTYFLDRWGEQHPYVAGNYFNLGDYYLELDDYDQALAYHAKALALRQATLSERHPDLVRSYFSVGFVHHHMSNYSEALRFYKQALETNISGGTDLDAVVNIPPENISTELFLLETLFARAQTLKERYDMARRQSDLREAAHTYDVLATLIDRMRTHFTVEDSKFHLSRKATDIYDQAIQTTLQLYRITGEDSLKQDAFYYAEKGKAGVLREALTEVQALQFSGVPDTLLHQERQLRIDLAGYETSLAQERDKPVGMRDSTRLTLFQNELFALHQAYQNLIAQFEADYPDYYRLKYQTRTASTDELQTHLLDEKTALVEYFVGADSLFIFTLTQDAFHVSPVPIDSTLAQQVEALRQGIGSDPNDPARAPNYERYIDAASRLYQTLLAPVQGYLHAEQLIIVPDGVLHTIPFEALLTQRSTQEGLMDYRTLPYLVHDYAVRYAHSATLLLETRERQRKAAPRDFLAFAPVFPEGLARLDSTLGGLGDIRAEGGALPATENEVKAIQDLFQNQYGFFERLFGKQSQVYLKKQAREARLKSDEAAQYRFVHLATHGLVDETTPELSHLRLIEEDTLATEDGVLYLSEVYTLSLNAALVVLSACETGTGRFAQGEGVIGLSWAFSYAGTEALMVSLWPVWDASTQRIMVTFYEGLLDETDKAEALRQAKQSMIQGDARYAMPYYWAPFILIGT